MTENNYLKTTIYQFAEKRCLLFDKISNEHNIIDNVSFHLAPRTGQIKLDGQEWSFFKHGHGYQFKDEKNVVIDIADFLISPIYFSQWELQLYLQSLSAKFIRKHCTGNVEVFLETKINNLSYLNNDSGYFYFLV